MFSPSIINRIQGVSKSSIVLEDDTLHSPLSEKLTVNQSQTTCQTEVRKRLQYGNCAPGKLCQSQNLTGDPSIASKEFAKNHSSQHTLQNNSKEEEKLMHCSALAVEPVLLFNTIDVGSWLVY